MKIGIITFHWANNYGAVLQAYALQEILRRKNVEVKIINYKPHCYDDNLWTFVRYRKFMNIHKYLQDKRKEKLLEKFRIYNLNLTERYYGLKQLQKDCKDFDVLITGSDQVLNSWFLQNGEYGGSTAYFLDFGSDSAARISYAASFGTTKYPQSLISRVSDLVSRFNFISTREVSGIDIFHQMNGRNPVLVPDPTLLHNVEFYDKLLEGQPSLGRTIRAYVLHNREIYIANAISDTKLQFITDEGVEQWLNSIKSSTHLITNSFHGTVFAILYKVPFTVVLPTIENIGMNDRFYTLLSPLNLGDRIVSEKDLSMEKLNGFFNWDEIHRNLEKIRFIGNDFLNEAIKSVILTAAGRG